MIRFSVFAIALALFTGAAPAGHADSGNRPGDALQTTGHVCAISPQAVTPSIRAAYRPESDAPFALWLAQQSVPERTDCVNRSQTARACNECCQRAHTAYLEFWDLLYPGEPVPARNFTISYNTTMECIASCRHYLE